MPPRSDDSGCHGMAYPRRRIDASGYLANNTVGDITGARSMNSTVSMVKTLDDLMRYDGKAELINGGIMPIMPHGFWPGKVSRRITRSLEEYVISGGARGE